VEIDGKIDRKGHTRALKDAQRMYNYWSSAGVEYGALQGKQPYLAPAEGIAGYEKFWDNLNTSNLPYLPYNAVDGNGNPIPMPQRQMPPVTAPMYMEGMRVASEEMKMASGQYDASMGKQSNETSGRAITARQRESDNATFHFIDNKNRAVRFTGKILIDLIPKVYDTARVVRILGEDGKDGTAQIDPSAPKAFQQQPDPMTGAIQEIYNPSVGRYDVVVASGPSYGTKRQEAFEALTEISARNPQMMGVAGDLIMQAADFPMAEQIADRLKKTLPPELQDKKEGEEDVPPQAAAEIAQLKQTLQQMEGALQNAAAAVDELEAKKDEIEIKRIDANTKAYDAITKRLQVLGPLIAPEEAQALAAETKREAMEQPDPGRPPSESMGVPEDAQEQQAPQGAFSLPE
jgi:Phage P22-like portal protein